MSSVDLSPRLTKHQRLLEAFELALSDFTDALHDLSCDRDMRDVPNRTKQLIGRVVSANYRRIDAELALESFLSNQKKSEV